MPSEHILPTNRDYKYDPTEPEIDIHFFYKEHEPITMYDKYGDPGDPGCRSSVEVWKVTQKGVDIIASVGDDERAEMMARCLEEFEEDMSNAI